MIVESDLVAKIEQARPPVEWRPLSVGTPVEPGRPEGCQVLEKTPRSVRRGQLRTTSGRADLLHRFLHHEVQAAELMAWALLAFQDADPAFRRGLLGILLDELRHARGYRELLQAQGADYGQFPIRDWFWQRIPQCATPLQFVALMGLGLEGANLDHTQRFASAFRAVGDDSTATFLLQVGKEEEAHVRFAAKWFRTWTGGDDVDFERWCDELVAPLTPKMFRGKPVDHAARHRAGLTDLFTKALENT